MMSFPGFSLQNVLFYPLTSLDQACSSLIMGCGKVKAAVLALKDTLCERVAAIVYRSPPPSLLSLPDEMVFEVFQKLEARDEQALAQACSAMRNLYTPAQRSWLAFEKQCLELIDNKNIHVVKEESSGCRQEEALKKACKKILVRLLDPDMGRIDLKRVALLLQKIDARFSESAMKAMLKQVIREQHQLELNFQAQLDKIKTIDADLYSMLFRILMLEPRGESLEFNFLPTAAGENRFWRNSSCAWQRSDGSVLQTLLREIKTPRLFDDPAFLAKILKPEIKVPDPVVRVPWYQKWFAALFK